jgi:50S ribosomal protein L16 3-hydroxylase
MPKRPNAQPASPGSARIPSHQTFHPQASARFAAPAPNVPAALLGNLSPAQFMRRYWQKKPLLIRGAIPAPALPLARDELFALAGRDEVESRLIMHARNKWTLEHGPFARDELPSLRQRAWTLLVQGVDLHDERARMLLDRFRFVPDARLDDLMISFATDGGGVGPHFDSYDVFLLQVHGRRRWRIGAQRDLTLEPGLPLKVLQHFEPDAEWLLEPGDMLYLPPHIAHDGVAEGECMTCSIGFRAPTATELTSQFLYHLAEKLVERPAERTGARRGANVSDERYRDPQQPAVTQPAQLPAALVQKVGAILAKVRWNDADVASFLGTYLSEPKPSVVFDAPRRPLDEMRFVRQASKAGIRLDRKSVLLYDRRTYYLNGEENALAGVKTWVPELADRRRLSGKRFVTLSRHPSMTARLHEWYCAGWIQVGELG